MTKMPDEAAVEHATESQPEAPQPPRAAWPDPKEANFTLERRSDPFNPGERHEGLRRRSTDKE